MSPASKSKSKDKKAGKEPSKPSGHANPGGVSASGYNPLFGTFHTLETAPASSAAVVHVNGRFRNIDDTDDHSGNSFGPGVEYDSVSNNGSWSGESEDHKEKMSHPPLRQDVVVPGADNDKREKIRQKNERKHQRQKERRAQELHERCSGYLMSRKLEALAQQFVAMGFSQERATMALILNEGRVEESVAWLFEEGEEVDKHMGQNLDSGGNLKIDISDELARIAEMEIRYKCTKQEVERAVVASEGNLDKAEESLRVQKQEPPAAPPKPEETGDPPTVSNDKFSVAVSENSVRTQTKPTQPTVTVMQQRRDDKDFNYTKVAPIAGSAVDPKSMQSLKRIQPRTEWGKPQQLSVPAEKRWPASGSNPSLSYSLASPLQASSLPVKTEARYVAVENELKILQLGSLREPVVMMQRPQSVSAKPHSTSSVSSSPPGTAAGWYSNSVETMNPGGLMPSNPGSRSLSPNAVSMNLMYNQLHYQQQQQQQLVSSSSSVESAVPSRSNVLWSRTGTSSTLAAASSLGLFSGMSTNGSPGPSSPVDWNSGSMLQLDYTNIDWSVDRGSAFSMPGGLWAGMNSYPQNSNRTYESITSGLGVKTGMRPVLPDGTGVSYAGLQEGLGAAESSVGGSREWTSPFEEKDLFSLSRQFVSSPSL